MKIRRIMILSLSLFLFISSLLTITFAFFVREKTVEMDIKPGMLTPKIYLYLEGVLIDESSIFYDQDYQSFVFELTDSHAVNHLSKLDVWIQIEAEIAFKLRVKLLESYVITRIYENEDQNPTIFKRIITIERPGERFYEHSLLRKGHDDSYVYGHDYAMYFEKTWLKGTHNIHLIDGGLSYLGHQHSTFTEQGLLRFNLMVEVVQSNRYQEVWGINLEE